MQIGRSEGHTEGNWVHSSSSGVGGWGMDSGEEKHCPGYEQEHKDRVWNR